MKKKITTLHRGVSAVLAALLAAPAFASSHMDAPLITLDEMRVAAIGELLRRRSGMNDEIAHLPHHALEVTQDEEKLVRLDVLEHVGADNEICPGRVPDPRSGS